MKSDGIYEIFDFRWIRTIQLNDQLNLIKFDFNLMYYNVIPVIDQD